MSHIIAVVNQKGGVGKTTTAVNVATFLAYFGKKVLLIDLDPQANATSGMGIRHNELEKGIYEAMVGVHELSHVILGKPEDRLHMAPATIQLAGATVELVNLPRREYRLHDAIRSFSHDYDVVVIDCPPSLGLLTLNGLVGATHVLIPVQAEYYALEGLGQLLNTINLVQQNLKPDLNILGAVITMYDKRVGLSEAVLKELYQYFPKKIFRSVIPRNVRLAEAPSHGMPIINYDDKSKGAKAYEKLTREILDALG
ncbi:MAG TPA: ParA family protein [Patescibacteria group bacterium]|nr:ParA family protein [Patescibacteria group bacterium]